MLKEWEGCLETGNDVESPKKMLKTVYGSEAVGGGQIAKTNFGKHWKTSLTFPVEWKVWGYFRDVNLEV